MRLVLWLLVVYNLNTGWVSISHAASGSQGVTKNYLKNLMAPLRHSRVSEKFLQPVSFICSADTQPGSVTLMTDTAAIAATERAAMPFELQISNIKIFPNPTDGDLTIEFDESNQNERIEIVDMLGVKVFEDNYRKHINIASLTRGIYFLKLLDKNNRLIVMERIVKK